MQRADEGDCVTIAELVLRLAEQLPVRLIDEHQDPRPEVVRERFILSVDTGSIEIL